MVTSPQVPPRIFQAVRAGLAVKRPYLDSDGPIRRDSKLAAAPRVALKMGRRQGGVGEASRFAPLGKKQSKDAAPTSLSRRADFRRQRYLRMSPAENLPPEFGNHGSGKERNISTCSNSYAKNPAEAKECSQLICSALKSALSIRPVTGILATDWNQRIALCVSGPIVPSAGP
jgi:hypothetical protein